MENNCPLCQADRSDPRWDQLWWAWHEKDPGLEEKGANLGLSPEEIQAHMKKHRSPQPPHPRLWRARDYSADDLSERERSILLLLWRGQPLSSEDLALLLLGPKKSDRSQMDRTLRSLLAKQMIYRLFLEHLPGPGARPKRSPALYMLGKSSRVVLKKKLRKRKDWFESLDDFPSWQDPYRSWQKNSRAAQIFSALPEIDLLPGGLLSQQSFLLNDPLLGKTRFRPESCLAVSSQEGRFLLTLLRDRPLNDPRKAIEEAVRFAALQRSGQLGKIPSLALLTTSDRERGKELIQLGEGTTFSKNSLVLLAPWSEIEKGNPRWRSLYHNQSGHLKDFLALLAKRGTKSPFGDKIDP